MFYAWKFPLGVTVIPNVSSSRWPHIFLALSLLAFKAQIKVQVFACFLKYIYYIFYSLVKLIIFNDSISCKQKVVFHSLLCIGDFISQANYYFILRIIVYLNGHMNGTISSEQWRKMQIYQWYGSL